MTQKAQALALAEPDTSLRAALDTACQDAGYELAVEPSAEVATSKLSARRYDALILDMTTPGAALVCLKARGKLVRNRIPVIALVEEEDEVAFARAYRAGADEVLLAGRPAALTARLRSLPKSGIPQPGASRGDAVVADADRARAEVLERVLRDAGFRVELAVDGFAARLQVGRPSLKVAVLDASLDDAPALITQARTRGARCAWIVRGRPDALEGLRTELAKLDRVAIVNAYGPPDDVLFETNRLLEPRETDGRADRRQLYGTIIRLKWDGQRETDIGYAYNVSSVGLYIRTLAAPGGSTVELELMPPGMDTFVKLKAEVIWRREFGTTRREPVPAGFGVKLIGGDLGVWISACPRALSMPPQSLRPALIEIASEPPPASTLSTVPPDAAPIDDAVLDAVAALEANAPGPPIDATTTVTKAPGPPNDPTTTETKVPGPPVPERAAAGPKRSPSTDKLRLPERLRAPIAGAFAAMTRPRKEPSPNPPKVVAKDQPTSPAPPKVTGREPQSSVEEMLLSVLGGSSPGEDVLGAAPLSIDDGEVVELGNRGAASAPSDEPPPPSIEPPPASAPQLEVRAESVPAAAPKVQPPRGNSEAPSIEVHRRPSSAAPARLDRASEEPTIEVARSDLLPQAQPPPPPPSRSSPTAAPRPAPPAAKSSPTASLKPAPANGGSWRRPSDPAELIEAEPLPSDPPKAPAGKHSTPPSKHSTMSGVGPASVGDTKNLPDLDKLAVAEKNREVQEAQLRADAKASDPLAATLPVAMMSPFPREALADGERSESKAVPEEPAAPPDAPAANPRTVSQVPPSASNIEPEPAIEIPETRSPRWLWISVFGVAAGVLSFLAVPMIRNKIAPEQPPTTPPTAAPSATAPAPVATATGAQPTAVDTNAAPETSATAAPGPAVSAAPEREVPPAAVAPSPSGAPPSATAETSADTPDESALASLEKGTGFLYVASPLQTNVYVYGILAGQTNQRLVSKCGPRFIRLGTAPGAWQSAGSVSIVKCGGFTRIQMAP